MMVDLISSRERARDEAELKFNDESDEPAFQSKHHKGKCSFNTEYHDLVLD